MGKTFVEFLPFGSGEVAEYDEEEQNELEEDADDDEDDEELKGSIFVCRSCSAHLTKGSDLVSKDFRGRSGKAYLFGSVINLTAGVPEDRMLITGMHTISDVFCLDCSKPLGWKYLHAFDERQRYKVGKVILEVAYVKRLVDGRPKISQAIRASMSSSSSSAS